MRFVSKTNNKVVLGYYGNVTLKNLHTMLDRCNFREIEILVRIGCPK
jgi:hypothetical protein